MHLAREARGPFDFPLLYTTNPGESVSGLTFRREEGGEAAFPAQADRSKRRKLGSVTNDDSEQHPPVPDAKLDPGAGIGRTPRTRPVSAAALEPALLW